MAAQQGYVMPSEEVYERVAEQLYEMSEKAYKLLKHAGWDIVKAAEGQDYFMQAAILWEFMTQMDAFIQHVCLTKATTMKEKNARQNAYNAYDEATCWEEVPLPILYEQFTDKTIATVQRALENKVFPTFPLSELIARVKSMEKRWAPARPAKNLSIIL